MVTVTNMSGDNGSLVKVFDGDSITTAIDIGQDNLSASCRNLSEEIFAYDYEEQNIVLQFLIALILIFIILLAILSNLLVIVR